MAHHLTKVVTSDSLDQVIRKSPKLLARIMMACVCALTMNVTAFQSSRVARPFIRPMFASHSRQYHAILLPAPLDSRLFIATGSARQRCAPAKCARFLLSDAYRDPRRFPTSLYSTVGGSEVPSLNVMKDSQSQQQNNVCVIVSDSDDNGSDGKIGDTLSMSVDFVTVAKTLSANMSLPLLFSENIKSVEESNDSLHHYSHCLRIIPYQYGELNTYAIAIQPMPTKGSDRDFSSRKRKRSSKKDRGLNGSGTMQPFFIDLCPPVGTKLARRIGGDKQRLQGSEMLLKAISPIKSGRDRPGGSNTKAGAIVYDLTAGFAQDSVIIAMGGASHVHMVERDPIVATLLEDSLRRLSLVSSLVDQEDPVVERAKELLPKLTLERGEGIAVARRISNERSPSDSSENQPDDRPDVCYLDPMFPPRTKSAAVKKNMQILHGLLGGQSPPLDRDEAEQELLEAAFEAARVRLVVKRPINAKPLGMETGKAQKPSYSVDGSVNRWDIYIK
eukprot:scaffold8882_cov51-Attheya_sp.AAC.6